MPWYASLVLVLAVMVLPILLGNYLARLVRMPDYGWKLALIFFAAAASVAVLPGWPPKRGVDLSGGVILVYEVDPSRSPGSPWTWTR